MEVIVWKKNIILVPHTYRKSIHIELQDANLMLLFDGFKNKNNNEDPYIFSDSFLYSFVTRQLLCLKCTIR